MSAASQSDASTRFLIVRLGAMGDVLHALPAVVALRAAMPAAHIGWVIEERWADLLSAAVCRRIGARSLQRPLVDAVYTVDTKRWRKSALASSTRTEVREVLTKLRGIHYAIAVDVQGALKSAIIARASGAGATVGFAAPRESAARMFYSRIVTTTTKHVVEQNVELVSSVAGTKLQPEPAVLPVDVAAENWCNRELARRGISQFAILNPGAGWGAKRWPAERFAEVARGLHDMGLASLVNLGPGEEDLAEEVCATSGHAAQTIACSIAELIALTRRAALFIGGDTGPMHLAAALQRPVVAMFGPTDPARNGPYGTPSVVLRHEASATSYSHRAEADAGLMAISSAEVISAAQKLLGEQIG